MFKETEYLFQYMLSVEFQQSETYYFLRGPSTRGFLSEVIFVVFLIVLYFRVKFCAVCTLSYFFIYLLNLGN